jgi:hypothetical protein
MWSCGLVVGACIYNGAVWMGQGKRVRTTSSSLAVLCGDEDCSSVIPNHQGRLQAAINEHLPLPTEPSYYRRLSPSLSSSSINSSSIQCCVCLDSCIAAPTSSTLLSHRSVVIYPSSPAAISLSRRTSLPLPLPLLVWPLMPDPPTPPLLLAGLDRSRPISLHPHRSILLYLAPSALRAHSHSVATIASWQAKHKQRWRPRRTAAAPPPPPTRRPR